MRRGLQGLALTVSLAFLATTGVSYDLSGLAWPAGSTVSLRLHLSPDVTAFSEGPTSLAAIAESALLRWNGEANIGVASSLAPDADAAFGNGMNDVTFAYTFGPDGRPFFTALALTYFVYDTSTRRIQEADVAFNASYQWDSYRGAFRYRSNGGLLRDFRRVAMHEFGHVLGLRHPNGAGQRVTALMNGDYSVIEDLQDDDIDGLQAIYGRANRPPAVTASCNPCTLQTGQFLTLSAIASDPDGDALTYSWSSAVGILGTSTRPATSWQAPWVVGPTSATVAVTDQRGGTGTASVMLTVLPTNRISAGVQLRPGQWIQSANGHYRLTFQTDGNLVLYDMTTDTPVWMTGTTGTPGRVMLQTDGNFVVYDAGDAPLWFSGTSGNRNAVVLLQDDGNLVIYTASGEPVWHRFM